MQGSFLLLLFFLSIFSSCFSASLNIGFIFANTRTGVSSSYTYELARKQIENIYQNRSLPITTLPFIANTNNFTCDNNCYEQISGFLGNNTTIQMIFLTSEDFSNQALLFATNFPNIKFVQVGYSGTTTTNIANNPNLSYITHYTEQAIYLNGLAAGLQTISGYVGYVMENNLAPHATSYFDAFVYGLQATRSSANISLIIVPTSTTNISQNGEAAAQLLQAYPQIDVLAYHSIDDADVCSFACSKNIFCVGLGGDIKNFVGDNVVVSALPNPVVSIKSFIDQLATTVIYNNTNYIATMNNSAVISSTISNNGSAYIPLVFGSRKPLVLSRPDNLFCGSAMPYIYPFTDFVAPCLTRVQMSNVVKYMYYINVLPYNNNNNSTYIPSSGCFAGPVVV